MRPLSILKYYCNNRKKFIIVVFAVFLSVFLLYFIQMLVDAVYNISYYAFVEPQRYYSSINAQANLLDDRLIDEVKNHPSVEKVIPWVFRYTNFYAGIGENTGTKVFTVERDTMEELMSVLHVKLREGRLPMPGEDEIALHYLVAVNKGLKIGDKIGSNVAKNEILKGEYTVVGFIEGKSIVSIFPLETWQKDYPNLNPYKSGLIILPKAGQMEKLNRFLEALPAQGVEVRTLNIVEKQNASSAEGTNMLLTVISLSVIIIVSVCTGFLSYISFYQRRSEFGLLSAIGYTNQQIINKAFLEVGGMNAAGFVLGLIACMAAGAALNKYVYIQRGQLLEVFKLDYVIKASCIPLLGVLFSVVPVWRMLKTLEPVSIIEGEV